MNKERYLSELSSALEESGKSTRYRKECINYATRLINIDMPVIFDLKHLSLLLGMNASDLSALLHTKTEYLYNTRKIPKKSGGQRKIMMPCLLLKYIQRWVLDNILVKIPVSPQATGFIKSSSIVKNARQHLGQACLLNIDIKDFFPSITIEDVFRIFYYHGYTKEVSYTLAKLCTVDGVLPQGSPASPTISNIYCLKLDKRISELCKKFAATYTRYADDITISGNQGISNMLIYDGLSSQVRHFV